MQPRLILVTDSNEKIQEADISNRNLEGNSTTSTKQIADALRACISDLIIYTDISEFVKNVNCHKSDLVFPMKYGKNSPDSKGIIPAICEGNDMRYVGGDAYSQILCNDKHLSKIYAKEFGIKSAKCALLRNPSSKEYILRKICHLKLPLVIKPNFGGGSTGISCNNIANSHEDAAQLAYKLYSYHQMPILVEEYIEGYEVELIIVGNKKGICFCKEVQLIMDGKEYFTKEIWGFETKKIDDTSITFKMSNFISTSDREKICKLFSSFDKIEFMRVDGREKNGEFFLLELSPDCYLGNDCAFYFAFENNGYSHADMFKLLIDNAQVLD